MEKSGGNQLRWLPRGNTLSDEVWRARHRLITGVALAQIPLLAMVGLASGETFFYSLAESLPILLLVAISRSAPRRSVQSILTSLALVSGTMVLIHFTGGIIESHFYFFVVLPLVALYADWRPFGAATALVILHHAVMGVLHPESVYNHAEAIARPLLWGTIHGGYVAALSVVMVAHWRFSEDDHRQVLESKNRLDMVFATAHDAIFVLDGQGVVSDLNEAAADILGVGQDEAVGLLATEMIRPLPLGEEQSTRTGASLVRPDGATVPVDVTIARATIDGACSHTVFVRDMTEVDRAMEGMQEAVKANRDLIASVSHELRTPLTGILGLSEELLDGIDLSDQLGRELLQLIAIEAADLSNLVEDLLASAKARNGKLGVYPEAASVDDLVRGLLTSGALRGTDIDVEVAPTLFAYADPLRVRQIVRNLLTNAVRYGGPRIGITATTRDGAILIEVRDSGTGVPDSVATRMFQPYVSAASGATMPKSIGLGLSVSAELAESMGGSLTYARRSGWSVFTLTVPCADAAATV